jgi:extracellular elastinolytic metalloproteinase
VQYGFNYTLDKLQLASDDLNITSYFTDNANITHIYFKHMIHGIEVSNHHAAIHLKNSLQVIAFSSSFNYAEEASLHKRSMIIHPAATIVTDEKALDIAKSEFNINRCWILPKKYVEVPSGSLVFAHVVECKDDRNYIQAFIDGLTGQIVQVIDFISSATYRVVPFTQVSPLNDLETTKDPAIQNASPFGWHKSTREFTSSQGNNARVYSVVRPENRRHFSEGGGDLKFENEFNPVVAPTEGTNRDLSITNLFYVINMMHDLSYQVVYTRFYALVWIYPQCRKFPVCQLRSSRKRK